MKKQVRIALAGNPNCGKTTFFNNLTGMRQHVGNWPGKTVEKKEGSFSYKGDKISIIDLPGTYSLTAYSVEEIVTRDYIVNEQPDVVIHIVDSCNLERNLYLTTQLIELGANVIVALNMGRFACKKGLEIDEKKLTKLLGVPALKIEAIDQTGKNELLDHAIKVAKSAKKSENRIIYGKEITEHLYQIENFIKESVERTNARPKWIALKLLEKDKEVIQNVSKMDNGKAILEKTREIQKHITEVFGEDVDSAIADARYGFIAGLLKESLKKPKIDKITRSENIDKIVTNKYIGIPVFLIAMYLLFQITFTASAPLVDLVRAGVGFSSKIVTGFLSNIGAPAWFSSLICDGIFGGVGSVLTFVPIIMILFFVISLLEDSGYMARAAFIMDKIMHKIGLHGKAFIPFLLGFGCTVPSIMATRTLESRKDRIVTMLLSPMMSCGARLPVYVLFTAAFFAKNQALIIFSIYMVGIAMAVIMGLIFNKTIFKGTSSPFVMELPPYRLPTLKGSLIHMWERGKLFMMKAGTVIFGTVLVIWFFSSVPFGVMYGSEQSAVGMMGKAIAPVFQPLGFGNWQAAVSLFFGLVAKEVVVGSMGTLYGIAEEGFIPVLQAAFTPLSAYAFMVFVLLYVPCLTVLATIKKETNSWKWPAITAAYLTVVAWVASFIVYQGGLLLGLG
ncbi:MAG: ferrous iron transport protein B [Nanoarchaeota archaeon]